MSKPDTQKKLLFLSKTKDKNRDKLAENLHKNLKQVSGRTAKAWVKELKNAQPNRD